MTVAVVPGGLSDKTRADRCKALVAVGDSVRARASVGVEDSAAAEAAGHLDRDLAQTMAPQGAGQPAVARASVGVEGSLVVLHELVRSVRGSVLAGAGG